MAYTAFWERQTVKVKRRTTSDTRREDQGDVNLETVSPEHCWLIARRIRWQRPSWQSISTMIGAPSSPSIPPAASRTASHVARLGGAVRLLADVRRGPHSASCHRELHEVRARRTKRWREPLHFELSIVFGDGDQPKRNPVSAELKPKRGISFSDVSQNDKIVFGSITFCLFSPNQCRRSVPRSMSR